ncbi:MAG TPA: GyrI-like domain-containing protein [Pseudolabrys sp.]|jgi:effector-binding domain-containing protein|nr:GyrI-like domain-containing protein [Pseudolabrys sp.]
MSRLRRTAPILAGLILALSTALAAAQQPAAPPAETKPAEQMPPPAAEPSPSPLKPGDAFGLEVQLPERTMLYLKGHTNWDVAFDTLVESFKTLKAYMDKEGIKASGSAMTVYTQTDETGFSFEAAYPIAQSPANPPKGDIAVGPAPSGKALKFVHRGSYDAMDTTYEAITNYLDDKQLDAKDLFIEEYTTDPLTSNQDSLVIDVFVPIK